MTSHVELNPDDNVLGLSLGMKAMRLALTQKTHKVGTVRIPTGGDTDVIIGDGAQDGANRIDRDGNQLPLVDTSGIDKAAQDARKAADEAGAKADEAIKQGEQIRQDAQAGIDDARKQAQDAAAKADKARSDMQVEMDANKQAADNAIANVDKKADKAQSDLEAQTAALKSSIANVDAKAEQVKADASKISQRVDADKAALDKSIASVDAKAQAASDKGDQLAGQISDVTTTVNGHTTKLGELSTRIEGVASDGQTTVKSLTSLQQTVTGLSSTVSQNTKTASDAMSKVSQVEQTANGISANLSKNYTTTADADEKYAAKTELKATADGLQANITRSQQTADGAVTAASKAQATADGFGATLSKDYQTTAASDEKYSTKADLKATSDSISSSLSSVKQTADGAVTAASKAQQTADAVTLNLSKNYQTKAQNDAVYATKTSLKVTSDSLSASISSTAKTAQSAVDKATSLEANLNGFKTTVAETYTTKNDFNNLTIGGRNLLVKSNFIKTYLDTVTGNLQSPDALVSDSEWNGDSSSKKPIIVDPDTTYVLSAYDSMTDTANYTGRISQFDSEGTLINFVVPGIYLRDKGHITFTTDTNAAYILVGIYSFPRYRWKLEKGTKPTDWSPAPEDLQPAGDYATNSSVTQTANSIKAQVTEVSKTANGAMSKATTVEQTANGLSSKITEQGKTLNATVKTANEAKSTADSNKQTISQVKTTADGAVNRVSSLEQNLDGFKSTVAKTYQTKDGMSAYATTSALKQTSGSITAEVSKVSQTATGALNKATSVEQTANGLSTKITEQGKTLNATVTTANEAKSTADSNKTTISQVSTTASNALSKAAAVEQNLSGFKTTVSETYSTKDDVRNLTISGTNLLLVDDLIACYVSESTGLPVNPYAGKPDGNCVGDVSIKDPIAVSANSTYVLTAYDSMPDTTGFTGRISQFDASGKYIDIALTVTIRKAGSLEFTTASTAASIYVGIYACPKYRWKLEKKLQPAGDYATNSSLTQTANSIKAQVSEVAKTATGAMGKASSVEQTASALSSKLSETVRTLDSTVQTVNTVKSTADSNRATLTQVAKTASDASSRASSVEQNLNGFKTTVSETYTTKTDFNNLTIGGRNLLVKSNFIKTYLDTVTGNLQSPDALVSDSEWNGDSSSKKPIIVDPDTTYVLSAYDSMTDTANYTGRISQFDSEGTLINFVVPGIYLRDKGHITFTTDTNAAYILVGIYSFPRYRWKLEKGTKPTDWSPAPEDLQPAGDYSTKSYVDQTAKSVALGVVQNYKGADGSGLATKSDITVEHERITSEVSGKYATKDGVTEEISSKVTQNNESLDVKFATKVEAKTAQDAADSAQSDASDAQSRVGTLEDCISLTSAGVRAGHQANGVFDGVSALVNTDGSFDLLDKDGNLLTRIYRHGLQVAGDDGVGSGHLILSQDGLDITVQPTANEKVTYHIQLGAGGISITAPDGSHVECSARTGLDLETVKYGKLSIGSGGLQFTNDQGWGLALSAAGWSLKWAGNHKLATGPAAGKLYIDGREIVTR